MYQSSSHQGSGASSSSHGPQMPPIVKHLSVMLHASALLMALSLAFLLFDNTLFAWHPLFMSVGYILFMAEGLLGAVTFRHLDGPERVNAIWSHAMMQLRAVVCITIGLAVIYRNKSIHGKAHFMSTHGKFGLATVILTVLAPIMGAVSFRRLGLIQRFPEVWQPRIKWLHKKAGVFVWLMSLFTIELALPHPAVNKGLLTMVWQVGILVVGGVMLAIMYKAQVKLKDQEEEDGGSKAV